MIKAVMFQGTGSSVGKSVLVAGIARALTNKGYKVLPFKPQNMSNNAAVTVDGGEIGRAQALQALACGVEPSVHMNPILLKPQNTTGSQIIVQGKIWGRAKAKEYQTIKAQLIPYVRQSFDLLSQKADIVLIEGAGSASEINLRHYDIANMGFAQLIQCPVILIGDIDRGGVIASLIGTHTVLSPEDLQLVKGFIVNKMRGDAGLFSEMMSWISQRTQWQNYGLLPYFSDLHKLPAEDAADLRGNIVSQKLDKIHISVLLLPTIANFDDFDPLKYEPNVQVEFIPMGKVIPSYSKVIIIPGSKNTIADLGALYQTGWDIDIRAHIRQGGYVLGICGGYQMLGRTICDHQSIETEGFEVTGLGFFNSVTKLTLTKQLKKVQGRLSLGFIRCSGYEMHVGVTTHYDLYRPFIYLDDLRQDGAISENGQIIGTYLHGIFHHDETRHYLLDYFGAQVDRGNYAKDVNTVLDAWADHIERHISIQALIT